jgi:hypothetical protein
MVVIQDFEVAAGDWFFGEKIARKDMPSDFGYQEVGNGLAK